MELKYYTFLNNENTVIYVIVSDYEIIDGVPAATWYGEFSGLPCVQTFDDGTRKNFAGVGFSYDSVRDAFIPPQPEGDFELDEETCRWVSPTQNTP